MTSKPTGYVVVLGKNQYLSRSEQTVRHTDRPRTTKGAERAWVHPPATVQAGGPWARHATAVIPAYYDKTADITRITGEPIPYEKFRAMSV
jgi:hypothetical protein